MTGTLYILATPIGNLDDITIRALKILQEVDLIAAEDTRHSKKLLAHFAVTTPLTSYHEHNEDIKSRELVRQLLDGKNIALITDAGTPTIADPGYRLLVGAIAAGVKIVPIPGPSAVTAALSAAGMPTDRYIFEGFLPPKGGKRRERLESLRSDPRTLVFYEAPHRIAECLTDILSILGDRYLVIARELTKLHEEFLRGKVSELQRVVAEREPRGEMTLIVAGAEEAKTITETELLQQIKQLKAQGLRDKEIATQLAERYRYPKNAIYRLALTLA